MIMVVDGTKGRRIVKRVLIAELSVARKIDFGKWWYFVVVVVELRDELVWVGGGCGAVWLVRDESQRRSGNEQEAGAGAGAGRDMKTRGSGHDGRWLLLVGA